MNLRARSVAARAPLREEQPGPGLRNANVRHQLDPHLDPWVSIDHFHMTEERRGGRPVAGHCIVTYLFEDSRGALLAHGDAERQWIGPGGLLWLQAGAGTVDATEPEHPGLELHGLRMVISLLPEHARGAPRALALSAAEVPEIATAGCRVRVLAGRAQGMASPLDPDLAALTVLDVHLDPGAELRHVAPAGHHAWALAVVGDGFAGPAGDERRLQSSSMIAFSGNGDAIRLRAGDLGLHAVVGHAPRAR
jgi:redox-sensitive bicupin YhaK (pirin superfamily)